MKLSKTPPIRFSSFCVFRPFFLSLLCLLVFSNSTSAQSTLMESYSNTYLEKLIQIAKENYPTMKSFEKRIDISKTNLAKAKLNWLDILTFSFIYNPNYTYNILNPSYFQGIQLGVSFNLANTLQKPLNVKSSRQELEVSRYDRDQYILTLETEVNNAYISYLQAVLIAKKQADAYNNSADLLKAVRGRFDRTEVTYDVYNQALISYGGAEQSKISAEATLLIAKRALEQLLGGRKLETIQP